MIFHLTLFQEEEEEALINKKMNKQQVNIILTNKMIMVPKKTLMKTINGILIVEMKMINSEEISTI